MAGAKHIARCRWHTYQDEIVLHMLKTSGFVLSLMVSPAAPLRTYLSNHEYLMHPKGNFRILRGFQRHQ